MGYFFRIFYFLCLISVARPCLADHPNWLNPHDSSNCDSYFFLPPSSYLPPIKLSSDFREVASFTEDVLGYYDNIDIGNLAAVQLALSIFDPKAVYDRAPGVELNGIAELYSYYIGWPIIKGIGRRQLRGRHFIDKTTETGRKVFVRGRFRGFKGGRPVRLNFTDDWGFNEKNRVELRISRIMLPGSNIRQSAY